MPVAEFMDQLEAVIPEIVTTRNELWQRVADGTRPIPETIGLVAITPEQQRRIRTAVEHTFILRNARNVALNRWLEEPGALR